MKIITLTAIAIMTAGTFASCCNNTCSTEIDKASAVIDAIMTRTSVRNFTDTPVEPEKLEQLVKAGMAAPTAVNRQPWAFIVVTEREQLDNLKAVHPYAQMLGTAQAAIIVCGDMTKALDEPVKSYWIQDVSAATENILIAAHALGLGAVWTGVYPNPMVLPEVSRVLEVPDYIVPLNIIPIGYPAGAQSPKDKWKPENVHYQRW